MFYGRPASSFTIFDCIDYEDEELFAIHDPLAHIKDIVAERPRVLQQPNHNGQLPLHFACARYDRQRDEPQRESIIRFLARKYPDALKKRDRDRMLPLHYAASYFDSSSVDTLRYLYKRYPKAIRTKGGKNDQLPLHFSIRDAYEFDEEKVQYLIDHYPASIRAKDSEGKLPLHLAVEQRRVSESSSCDAVGYLVEHYPEGLETKDRNGNLPLHLAILNFSPNYALSFDLVQFLVNQYPEGVPEKNKNGMLPLHIAIERNAGVQMIQYLVEQYPQGVQERFPDGRLPLHFLIEKKGALRLDSLADWFASVQFVMDTFPQALQVPNPQDGLLPALMAAIPRNRNQDNDRHSTSLEAIYVCIRKCPHFIH